LLLVPVLVLIDRQQRRSHPFQAEWLEAGGIHFRALRTGVGDTTLLLLHGYGESLVAYRGLIGDLERRYSIVAVDLPGSGLSESPSGSYTLDTTVARVSALLDRWTHGPVVAVGHSMGGEIAAALALARPDRIEKLVLIAPAGYGLGLGIGPEPFTSSQQQVASWSLKARSLLIPIEAPDWLLDPPDMPEGPAIDSAAREAAGAILRDFDFAALRDRFREIRQPTLLIWGGLDPLIPIGIGRRIAAEIPDCRLVVLGNSWHRPHVEQPDRVVQEILRFLSPTGKP
jgi:pimeloyl-ACP methyl ester carboxylesterase